MKKLIQPVTDTVKQTAEEMLGTVKGSTKEIEQKREETKQQLTK